MGSKAQGSGSVLGKVRNILPGLKEKKDERGQRSFGVDLRDDRGFDFTEVGGNVIYWASDARWAWGSRGKVERFPALAKHSNP